MIGIKAIGAVTAAGDDAPNTMAALVSGLQLYDELDLVGSDGERLTGATTGLPKRLRGLNRLGGLGLLALAECAAKAPPGLRAPVLVCAPAVEDLGGAPARLLELITAEASVGVDRPRSLVFATGRASFAEALAHALGLLKTAEVPACYLVGVDSLTSSSRAARLWKQRRVLEPANADGFIPGEAGVCLLVGAGVDDTCLAAIAATGAAQERGGGPISGVALNRALASALGAARIDASAVGALVHDAPGDRPSIEELTLATQREPFNQLGAVRVHAPADVTGEVGAAAGPLSVAMAAFFAAEGVDGLDGAPALVASFSEGPSRLGVVVGPTSMPQGRRPLS
jgi:3-oxoacyl-[acyl-carrier-protein] synthase-1